MTDKLKKELIEEFAKTPTGRPVPYPAAMAAASEICLGLRDSAMKMDSTNGKWLVDVAVDSGIFLIAIREEHMPPLTKLIRTKGKKK